MSFRLALTETATFTAAKGATQTVRQQAIPSQRGAPPVVATSDAVARLRMILGN